MNSPCAPRPAVAASCPGAGYALAPLPAAFSSRVQAGGPDDFGRPARRLVAQGGEPMRDRLRRAVPGESLLLCSYQAVPLPSAFAEIGPVFVAAEPGAAAPEWADGLPAGYFNRPFALRAYDALDQITESALVTPAEAPAQIRRWLERPGVAYLHARFAGHGCYACRFDRGAGLGPTRAGP